TSFAKCSNHVKEMLRKGIFCLTLYYNHLFISYLAFKTGIAGWCAKNAFPPRCDWNRDEAIIKSCS
ncbi:MAG: hypothetical protein ABSF51_09925, partial [Verrucomicrobiota bacterium]